MRNRELGTGGTDRPARTSALPGAGWSRPALALLAALLAAGGAGCADPEPEAPADPVVVSGNGVEVRQSAFADEYRRFASRAPVRDGLEARRDYARLMLERAYVARVAEAAGLGELPEVRAHVERRRRFAMRRRFLEDTLGTLIEEPTEADVREAFRRQNSRVRVRQAFAPTEEGARALWLRARSGEPFADLARASMAAVGLDATGEMGWVTFNDLDEGPEDAVFALGRGGVSEPVRSMRGWHVFEVLDREETARIDATAFEAARERLAAEVRQRRIDEAGARALKPLLESHALVVRLEPLRALWPSIAPLVPDRGEVEVLAQAQERLPTLRPDDVPRSTPVATVDGRPFTVGQLLDELPEIPVELWRPDLRQAVEVAVRDSILTARAAAAGAADAPDVQREAEAARRTALYYAGLRAAVDTLDAGRHARRFYALWRDGLVQDRTTTFLATPFATEAAAREALARAQGGAGWEAVAAEAGTAPERRTATAPPGEPGPFGVHRMPLSAPGRRALAGPFPDGGRSWVVEAVDRADAYVPFADARADVVAAIEAEPRAAAHQLLLDAGFDPTDVAFDDDALLGAVPLGGGPAPPGTLGSRPAPPAPAPP